MATCNDLLKGLNPGCEATNKAGGINKRVYIGQKSQLSSYTTNATSGDIESLTMDTIPSTATPYTLYKFVSRKDKNSAAWPMTAGENVNTFNHTTVMALYYSTTEELQTIKDLCNADDLFAIVEGNDKKMLTFGIELGMNASAGDGGTGNVVNDSTAYTVTLSGEQTDTPRYFNCAAAAAASGADAKLAANIAYLEAIAV